MYYQKMYHQRGRTKNSEKFKDLNNSVTNLHNLNFSDLLINECSVRTMFYEAAISDVALWFNLQLKITLSLSLTA